MSIWADWMVPSVIGFAVGMIVGYLIREIADVTPIYRVSLIKSPAPRGWHRFVPSGRTALGVLLIVLSAMTYYQAYRSTACIRDGILDRSDAQGRETRAQIELLEAQIDQDPTNGRAAIRRYLEAARELEAARVANPLRCP